MQIAKDDEAVTARLAAGRSAERFPLSEALLTGMACGQSRVELSQRRDLTLEPSETGLLTLSGAESASDRPPFHHYAKPR